jgi:hypothetical protein
MTSQGPAMGIVAVGLLVLAGCAPRQATQGATTITPPSPRYQRVSLLFPPFPDYIPHQGTLYVDPTTVPIGPYLVYSKQAQLVGTMYMIPIREFQTRKTFKDLGVAPNLRPLRVEWFYQDAHPGVVEPHYHVILWYVPPEQQPT